MEAVEADGGDVLDDSLCTERVVFWCMDPTQLTNVDVQANFIKEKKILNKFWHLEH